MDEDILNRVRDTVDRYAMLRGVTRLLIGFSAGPDSVALLDILHRLYGDRIRFYLGYVNHGLRKAAAKEEAMTRHFAQRYNAGYRIMRVDLKNIHMHEGLEAAARDLRYKNLICLAASVHAQKIALAHHADDFLETFLLNLARGGGMLGLSGMPPVRGPVIRPMMAVKKNEVLEYVRKRKLPYSFDRTNLSLRFRRNYVRKEIVPRLCRLNANIHTTLMRGMEVIRAEDEHLQAEADAVYRRLVKKTPGGVSLDIRRLFRYNIVYRRRVVRNAIFAVQGHLHGIEFQHIERILEFAKKRTGRIIPLPNSLVAEREYGNLLIVKPRAEQPVIDMKVSLNRPAVLPELGVVIMTGLVRSLRERHHIFQAPRHVAYFDYDALHPPLALRGRRPGDVLVTFDGHRKKIKDLFIDQKLPRRDRARVPLLVDQKDILWAVGVARSGCAKVTGLTKRILVVKVESLD